MSELHEAASTGDLVRVEDALKRGLSPDEPDIDWSGRTPLHIACAAGHKKCVYVLLKEGADPNAVTEYGWTAAHFSCEAGECIDYLIERQTNRDNVSPALSSSRSSLLFADTGLVWL